MISSYQAFRDALTTAKRVDLCAYMLPAGETESALIDCSARGADVHVHLDEFPFFDVGGALRRRNALEVQRLQSAGIHADLSGECNLHTKAAVIDGVTFLDDKNWTGPNDLLLCDHDADDARRVLNAEQSRFDGSEASSGLALQSGPALLGEAAVLGDGAAELDVATEAIGPSLIAKLLRERAPGTVAHLIVAKRATVDHARAYKAIAALQSAGVEIRTDEANEKYAVAGALAWAGSANAGGSDPSMGDWGMILRDASDVEALRGHFALAWDRAKPYENQVARAAA